MRRPRVSDDQLRVAVASSHSYAEVLRRIGLIPAGGNYRILKGRMGSLGLNASHLVGQRWALGKTFPNRATRPLSEVLIDGKFEDAKVLKRRLFREGLKEHRCELCGLTTWSGRPIPLELDHINGHADDNRLSNLRLICPNCHAQTPTYRGRNIGRYDCPRIPTG